MGASDDRQANLLANARGEEVRPRADRDQAVAEVDGLRPLLLEPLGAGDDLGGLVPIAATAGVEPDELDGLGVGGKRGGALPQGGEALVAGAPVGVRVAVRLSSRQRSLPTCGAVRDCVSAYL